jgi:PAS domain S-box-containing protein
MNNNMDTYEELLIELEGLKLENETLKVNYEKEIIRHVKLEESLKKLNQDFETIFNMAPVQVWYKDTQNNYIRVNQQVCTDTGMTKDEIEGHSAEDIFPLDAQKFFRNDLVIMNTGKPKLGIVEQVNTVNGDTRWSSTSKIPTYGKNNEVIGLIIFVQDITMQKRTQEALCNSESRLHTLIQTIPDLIWLKNEDGVYLSCNTMFERFFGASEVNLVGKTDYDFVERELADSFRKHDNEALKGGKPLTNEELITFADDGHHAYLETVKTPMYDTNGTLIGILGIAHDITKRKLAEAALIEKEFLLAQSQSLGHIGSWGWDLKGSIKWSDETFRIYGVSREKFTPTVESLILLIHPEDRPAMQRWIEECLTGKSPDNLEFRIVYPDGAVHFINGMGDLIYDAANNPTYIGGTIQDITTRKRIEEELRQSEARFRSTFDQSPVGSVIVGLDKCFVRCNTAFCNFLGYSEGELIGKSIPDITYPDDAKLGMTELKSLRKMEIESVTLEKRYVKKDGDILWGEINICLIFDVNSKPIYYISIIQDITRRKLVELINQQQRIQLQELNAGKDKFFSIIAHDLKSPFQGFLVLTEYMAKEANSFTADELAKLGNEMHKSADNIFNLLKNLLQWAQIQQGSINFEPVQFSLSNLIANNVKIIRERSMQKGIAIINTVTGTVNAFIDEKMINSVILNLLCNAVKFTNKDGTITIKLNTTLEKMIEISVSDTGVGMQKSLLDKLFKLGEKKGRIGTDGELSTGLGLLLCKEFIEKHNGKIWAESEPNKGSSFHFTIPRTN